MFLKWLFGFLKTPVANLVAELKAQRDANIAAIESTVGGGTQTAEAAVTGCLTKEAQKSPMLGMLVGFAEPEILAALGGLVQEGNASVPALYDKGVAWLEHEEAVL